jgi:hypothetical protein
MKSRTGESQLMNRRHRSQPRVEGLEARLALSHVMHPAPAVTAEGLEARLALSHEMHPAPAPVVTPAAALPTKLGGTVVVHESEKFNPSTGFTTVFFSGVGAVNPLGKSTRVLIGIEFAPGSTGTPIAASMLAAGKYTSFAVLTNPTPTVFPSSNLVQSETFTYTIISGAGSLRMRTGSLEIHAVGSREFVTFE